MSEKRVGEKTLVGLQVRSYNSTEVAMLKASTISTGFSTVGQSEFEFSFIPR
jgi:hypothetical protein